MAKDSLSLERAGTLARKIERVWAASGYAVRAWVEPIPGIENETLYQIRSDMVNGLPRGYASPMAMAA